MRLLRYLSLADGLSLVVLLYFAIYEKRILGKDEAVRLPGMIHGVIFMGLCGSLAWVRWRGLLSWRGVGLVFLAAWVPFMPFFLDPWLKRKS